MRSPTGPHRAPPQAADAVRRQSYCGGIIGKDGRASWPGSRSPASRGCSSRRALLNAGTDLPGGRGGRRRGRPAVAAILAAVVQLRAARALEGRQRRVWNLLRAGMCGLGPGRDPLRRLRGGGRRCHRTRRLVAGRVPARLHPLVPRAVAPAAAGGRRVPQAVAETLAMEVAAFLIIGVVVLAPSGTPRWAPTEHRAPHAGRPGPAAGGRRLQRRASRLTGTGQRVPLARRRVPDPRRRRRRGELARRHGGRSS